MNEKSSQKGKKHKNKEQLLLSQVMVVSRLEGHCRKALRPFGFSYPGSLDLAILLRHVSPQPSYSTNISAILRPVLQSAGGSLVFQHPPASLSQPLLPAAFL